MEIFDLCSDTFSINKKEILKHFPNIQLPDDTFIEKPTYADTFIALPKGRKCILWFTTYLTQNIPIVLYLDNQYNIIESSIFNVCFNDELTIGKGTILTGIIFKLNNIHHFTCCDINYYKGQLVENKVFKMKLNIFEHLFKYNIKQIIFDKNTLLVGLPVIKTNYREIISYISHLSYPVYAIRLCKYNSVYSVGVIKYKVKECLYAFFNIKATIENDIYNIYCRGNNNSHGIAMISDYKTSVMMNKLFRNIKENENLDFLEHSDDEEEFEDTRQDKYVDLNKELCMKCIYVSRFGKWRPVSIAPKHVKPSTYQEVMIAERKK
jgi:hypothetical protein